MRERKIDQKAGRRVFEHFHSAAKNLEKQDQHQHRQQHGEVVAQRRNAIIAGREEDMDEDDVEEEEEQEEDDEESERKDEGKKERRTYAEDSEIDSDEEGGGGKGMIVWGAKHDFRNKEGGSSNRIPWSPEEVLYLKDAMVSIQKAQGTNARNLYAQIFEQIKGDEEAWPIFHKSHVLSSKTVRTGCRSPGAN